MKRVLSLSSAPRLNRSFVCPSGPSSIRLPRRQIGFTAVCLGASALCAARAYAYRIQADRCARLTLVMSTADDSVRATAHSTLRGIYDMSKDVVDIAGGVVHVQREDVYNVNHGDTCRLSGTLNLIDSSYPDMLVYRLERNEFGVSAVYSSRLCVPRLEPDEFNVSAWISLAGGFAIVGAFCR